ncbi:hypothetical protein LTR95_018165, partial [Oleoguttula sp. CCFEE 5521]
MAADCLQFSARFHHDIFASLSRVNGGQDAEFEAESKEMKAGLKDKKAEVRAIIGELEEKGRELVE